MIIQLDHIAVSLNNFAFFEELLGKLGYQATFHEAHLPNPIIKKKLSHNYQKSQALVLFTAKNNISIELVNHGSLHQTPSYLQPVFDDIPPGLVELEGKTADWFLVAKNAPHQGLVFNKILVSVKNIPAAVKFWQALGFQQLDAATLAFTSLFNKQPLRLMLVEKKHLAPIYLDNAGFSCLAFVSNSVRKDKERLAGLGYETTELDTLTVNNRTLEIFFCQGPSGEPVEIIGLRKEKK